MESIEDFINDIYNGLLYNILNEPGVENQKELLSIMYNSKLSLEDRIFNTYDMILNTYPLNEYDLKPLLKIIDDNFIEDEGEWFVSSTENSLSIGLSRDKQGILKFGYTKFHIFLLKLFIVTEIYEREIVFIIGSKVPNQFIDGEPVCKFRAFRVTIDENYKISANMVDIDTLVKSFSVDMNTGLSKVPEKNYIFCGANDEIKCGFDI